MIPGTVNRIVSSISVEPPGKILNTLEDLVASHSLERPIAKAASHGLEANLSLFRSIN
ncbi:MAG: hypothetical protein ACHQUC_09150 [Chlamydiales bacterium]